MKRGSHPERAAALPAPAPLAVGTGLEAYTAPLDTVRATHLLRRTGFGVSPDKLDDCVGQAAEKVVNQLVNGARAAAMPAPPPWIDAAPPPRGSPREQRQAYNEANRIRQSQWTSTWFAEMYRLGLRERMTLFWHNHFVTEYRGYGLAPLAYRYTTLLRQHALGNFKELVWHIGVDPAMLLYLNGAQNRAGAPNENYARELLELFTMGQLKESGQPNYTQQDIEAIARALTGWTVDRTTFAVQFRPGLHDDGEKTLFGRTGTWDYDDVIDILFTVRRRSIALFMARKLYAAFIYAAPDAFVIESLAELLIRHDFEIAPVLRVLLSSAHFFDHHAIGAKVKSPVEVLLGFMRSLEARPVPAVMDVLPRFSSRLDQALFNPPDVAGWPSHRAWLSTTTFVARWTTIEQVYNQLDRHDAIDLVALARTLHDPNDAEAVFTLAVALAERLLAVPLDLLDLALAGSDFAGDLVNNPIPDRVLRGPAYARNLAKLLLAGTPWYEWDLTKNRTAKFLRNYVFAVARLPEFQLT